MEQGYRFGTVLLDKYHVESVLGRGGMGTVLRATHIHLGEEVALKILSPDAVNQDAYARFLREAQAVVRLRGEHVARVSDVGILPDGAPYMVMEYLRGVDLAAELKRRGALNPGEAVDYVLQACEALAEAHSHGIIHRDIKPSNLFLTARPDGTPLVKVLDFGISKAPAGGGSLTRTDTVMGTPGYMSPEQMKAARDVDARTDIWALGVVLHECLSGRPPFEAEAFSAVVLKAATEPPPPLDPRLPRGLQDIVLRCMAKDRAERHASIAELAAALAPFARDQRGAAIVVDRTRVMLGVLAPTIEQVAPADRSQITTIPDGAAARRVSSRRFRYTLASVVSLFAAIGVVAAVLATRAGRSETTTDPPVVAPAPQDAGVIVLQMVKPGDKVEDTSAVVDAAAAAPSGPPAQPDDARAQVQAQIVKCTEAMVQKDWPGLEDCSQALRGLGTTAKADEFHDKAVQELKNSLADADARAALRAGKLKDAEALLQKVGSSSVYFKSLSDVITKVENAQVDDARRRAQALANVRDCNALKNFVRVLAQGNNGTERVVAAAMAVKCVDKAVVQPAVPGTGRPSAGRSAGGTESPTPARNICETMNIDDVMSQASSQFNAGFAKAALVLVTKALSCRQDVRMYRFATVYACAARDAASARLYYAKLPAQFQSAMVQRCQQENIALP